MNTKRIAMWSGPRTISTAMLRAWENRADTVVVDEPLYANYFRCTSVDHPGREEVLAAQENHWRDVARQLIGPVPQGRPIFYQKHMAHHLLPDIDREWLWDLEHAFLLREPRELLLSLHKVTPNPQLEDTGLPQLLELFRDVESRTGQRPPVLDGKDVLQDPAGLLAQLCERLGVAFDEAMLAWPAGKRDSDGVWAPYWYAAVERSTGFEPWRERAGELAPELQRVYAQCLPLYEELHQHRLGA